MEQGKTNQMRATPAIYVLVIYSYNSHFQWRSYTRAHKGLGPGNFLSALVTFEALTSMLSS